ncbi:hypothetical protein PCE1_001649 [Barthelona sp. PCE]
MGNILSLFKRFRNRVPPRILIVGLAAAGKTTILHRLADGEFVENTMPTIGFNHEFIKDEETGSTFTAFDLSGQTGFRHHWGAYSENTSGIIFVVDSTDIETLNLARDELWNLLNLEELSDCVFVVFANKTDLPDCMGASDISQRLNLYSIRNNAWSIFETSAKTGKGLLEGFGWLAQRI